MPFLKDSLKKKKHKRFLDEEEKYVHVGILGGKWFHKMFW